jgi:thioredoxin-dependent peroxiredoxin
MKRWLTSICALLVMSVGAAAWAEELKAGDAAPAFRLVDAEGKEYTLDQFKGKQGVVLAWFPRAFTPGCTIEIKSIRDSAAELSEFDVSYFMVSLDPPDKNAEFAAAHECDFPVLSDPDGETAKAYDVGAPGALFAKRWTFFIGADGEIKHVERGVNVSTHGADIVQKLGELGFPKKESAD